MLPLLAVGGGLLQGALGAIKAKGERKRAEEMERENRSANVMDQAWAGMLGQKERRQETFDKPSVLGGALQGAMAGAMQGSNIYQGLKDSALNRQMKEKLLGQGAQVLGGEATSDPNLLAFRDYYMNKV
jgi:hypothetical protein